jgi:hypothetical protein
VSRKLFLLSSSFTCRANLAAVLGAACIAGTAAAMPEDTFPQGRTRADILGWLAGNSDLKPDSVVAMTDELVVAVAARQDGRGVAGSTRLTLREEVIDPAAAAVWGGRSIQLDLDLDCSRRRILLGVRRVYARPNLQGSALITRSDTAWTEAPHDTVIEDVARFACGAQTPAQLAAAQPAPSVHASAAEPPAAAPAARLPDFAVEIASVASADLARDRWRALKARVPDLVGSRTFAVEPVSANGRTQFRALLLGFSSRDEAAALCKALRDQSLECVLREMR